MKTREISNSKVKDGPTLAMARHPSEVNDEGQPPVMRKSHYNQEHNPGDLATGKVQDKPKAEKHHHHHNRSAQVLSDGTRVTKYKKTKTLPDGVLVTKAVVKTVYPIPVTGNEMSSPRNPDRVIKKVNTKTRKTSPGRASHITTTVEEIITTNNNSLDPGIAVQPTEHTCILPDGSELTTMKQSKRLTDGSLSTSLTKVHAVSAKKTEAKQLQTDNLPSTVQSPEIMRNAEMEEVQAEFDSSFSMMGSPEVLPDFDSPYSSNTANGLTFSSPATFENVSNDEEAQRRNLEAIESVEDYRNDKQSAKRSVSLQAIGVGAHFIIPSANVEEGNLKKKSVEFQQRRSLVALETCSEEPIPMELLQKKTVSIPSRGATFPPESVYNNDHKTDSATNSKALRCPQSLALEPMENYDEEPIPMDVRDAEQKNAKKIVSLPGRGVGAHVIDFLKFKSHRALSSDKDGDIESHFRVATVIKRGLLDKPKYGASQRKNSSVDLKDQSKRDHSSIDIVEDSPNNGLAVATKVDQSEDNEPIYAAIEYDPFSKPPIYKNRRCRLYTSMSLLLITIIIALVVVYSTKKGKEEVTQQEVIYITEAPTLPPTTDREALGIDTKIEEDVLQRRATFHDMEKDDPRWLALDWILHKDGMQLEKTDLNLYQRYVLALLAFQFDSLAWSSCGGNYSDGEMAEYATCTIEIENTTDTAEEYVRWLSSSNECNWYGVTCLDGKVRSLELPENNLIGKIPPEISILRFIDVLKLDGNCLVGTLPSEMGCMSNLQQLNLEYNGLSGYVPDEFFNMSSLTHVHLAGQSGNEWNCTSSSGELIQLYYNLSGDFNSGLEGDILEKIGNLRHLKEILVDDNYFSGSITPDIKNLKQLEILSAENNAFSGTIPEEISEMVNLREIRFGLNWLSGSLPGNIGQAKALEVISLYGTDIFPGNMTGTIPDSLYNLTNLKELYLYSNEFRGIIKSDIGNLKDLTWLSIAYNQFTGTLPSELGNCEKLEWVQIDHNQIGGTVPEEVCALKNKNLYSENPESDEYLKADCLPNNETSLAFIQCDCCSVCCDHATNQCINYEA
eukprot:CCRYP_008909-RA/>CCRYP_008909-RA protein AED:0.31 eAED:0.06 QI:0/1/0.6/1/1/1/5/0/1068